MALIWIIPAGFTLVACLLGYRWQQQLDTEVAQLRDELQVLPVLATRTRAVQLQTDRATRATADVFGPHLPK